MRDGAGALLGFLAGSVLRIRRRDVDRAMARGGVPADAAPAMYRALGRGVFELLWVAGSRTMEPALDTVVFTARFSEALDDALAKGGVVLGVSHTANWELGAFACARLLAARGRTLSIVAKRQSVGAFNAFCMRLRQRAGIRVVAPDGGVTRAAAAVLAEGNVLAMPIDQVPDHPRHGTPSPFLGAPALVDRAPFAIAARAHVDVLVVGCRREGDRIHAELIERVAPGDLGVAPRRATAALDAFVRRAPRDWLWLHRRWRAAPAAPEVTTPTLVAVE